MSENRIDRVWRCDNCGGLIRSFGAGRVEWLCRGDQDGRAEITGLRLVHAHAANPPFPSPYGCEYNPREEFQKDRSLVEGLPFSAFSGVDGLMLLLSMLARGEYPAEQLIELTKRVHVCGYEATRELFPRAIREQIVAPVIGPGYYLQCEIRDVLSWEAQKAEPHRTKCGLPEKS